MAVVSCVAGGVYGSSSPTKKRTGPKDERTRKQNQRRMCSVWHHDGWHLQAQLVGVTNGWHLQAQLVGVTNGWHLQAQLAGVTKGWHPQAQLAGVTNGWHRFPAKPKAVADFPAVMPDFDPASRKVQLSFVTQS